MILSDKDIKAELANGLLKIEPLTNPDVQIQAACVDLTLSNELMAFAELPIGGYIDLMVNSGRYTDPILMPTDDDGNDYCFIHPNEFILGKTIEKVTIPDTLAASIDGRSSLGRIGLMLHVTSGWIDPGFRGHLVLEIKNVGPHTVKLIAGMRVAKLVLFRLSSIAERPYNTRQDAKYRNQSAVEASKIALDRKV